MLSYARTEWDAPPLVEQVLTSPVKLLLRIVYHFFLMFRSAPKIDSPPITVVCISDTHTEQEDIPPGDLLVHAGDLTNAGSIAELQAAIAWLASLPHTHKIAISGNHDTYLDARSRGTLPEADRSGSLDWLGVHYLQHSSRTITFPDRANRQLTIYGAPQIPACGGAEFAFQYPRGQDAWSETVPSDTDILVTHIPPKCHRDLHSRHGCEWLLKEVWRVKPRLHVFGHIHAMPGTEMASWDGMQQAYEEALMRESSGLIGQILDFGLWIQLARMVVWGLRETLWDLVWGGKQQRTTLVNAALMSQETGKVEHVPQVVKL